MYLTNTPLLNLMVIHGSIIEDHRGYFCETYHASKLAQLGMDHHFVQDNQSYSKQGTIRGLHYQLAPHAQTKLIRVIEGEIWDVAVDLRQGSPTFGKWEGILLSGMDQKQLLIPAGFAHGFSVRSEHATVFYKCDAFYHPAAEAGIHYLDPQLNIDWKLGNLSPIFSQKDESWPNFSQANMNFIYS